MQECERGKGIRRTKYKSRGRGQAQQNGNCHGTVTLGYLDLVFYLPGSIEMKLFLQTLPFFFLLGGSASGAELVNKHVQGPRMPDGTRGFTFGRGKPAS